MKQILPLTLILTAALAAPAHAANFAVIATPPTALSLVLVGVAVGCLLGSVKVMGLIRGGQLTRGWQMFVFAFAALALGQFVSVLKDLELVRIPGFIVPALLVVMAGLFLYGVYQTRRTLE